MIMQIWQIFFPFANVDYMSCILNATYGKHLHLLNITSTGLNFSLFNYKGYGVCDDEKIDPDKKMYYDILVYRKYYKEQQFNSDVQLNKEVGISVMHL